MASDPQLASTIAFAAAIGWTMVFPGRKKRLLESKQGRRRCPSCGRTIGGRVCDRH